VAAQNGEAYLAELLGPGYDATWMNPLALLSGEHKPWWTAFTLYTADSSDQAGCGTNQCGIGIDCQPCQQVPCGLFWLSECLRGTFVKAAGLHVSCRAS
jgi:hypothetical protein